MGSETNLGEEVLEEFLVSWLPFIATSLVRKLARARESSGDGGDGYHTAGEGQASSFCAGAYELAAYQASFC